jgi:hypothetical protein
MYFLLTGHAPFATGSIAARLLKHRTERPVDIAELRTEVPKSLIDLCERMMEKSPEDRFASMADVVAALQIWRATQHHESRFGDRVPSQVLLPADAVRPLPAASAPAANPEEAAGQERREVQQLLSCLDHSMRVRSPDVPVSTGTAILLSSLRDHIDALLELEHRETPSKPPKENR